MLFGVTNTLATFQRMMNVLFKEELDAYVLVYLDNVLIFLQTLEEHIQHIRKALQKLRDVQFFARLHKCSLFQTKVEYLILTYQWMECNQAQRKFARSWIGLDLRE